MKNQTTPHKMTIKTIPHKTRSK